MSLLRYGQAAPEFTLPSTSGGTVTLSEFRGQAGDRHMVRDGTEILRVLDMIDALRRGA